MPTSREMAEELKRMEGATNADTNRATIQRAADALVVQDKRVAELEQELEDKDRAIKRLAELERRLAQVIAASADSNDLTLVAKGGEKLRVKASLARAASPYFAGLIDSGFKEAGTMRDEFDDVEIIVLRFVVEGMHAGEAGADLVALPSPFCHDAKVIEQIIGFSGRLLMPWLAQAAARRALESTNAAMLADLLLAAEGYVQRERDGGFLSVGVPSVWEELSEAVVQRLAALLRSLVEAGKVEAFFRLPLGFVQRILALVNEAAWPEWHELAVVAQGAGKVSSPTTKEGVYLEVDRRADGNVLASVVVVEGAIAPVVIGSSVQTGFEFEIQALKGSKDWEIRLVGIVYGGWLAGLVHSGQTSQSFLHGGSYKFRFRARRTKLHTQCQVLLKCVEAHLPADAREQPLIVPALELLRTSQGLKDLHTMLVEYIARAFGVIGGEVLGRLSCCDMEAIITHPCLDNAGLGEFSVLQAVLIWAKSSQRLMPSVGATVRVRNNSEHVLWCGKECRVVKKIDIFSAKNDPAASLWEIERASDPAAGTLAGVRASDLLCPGHIGLEKLLEHVRFPFIKPEQIKGVMQIQGVRAVLGKSPAFKRGWTEAFEVQICKRKAEELGERAQKRTRYRKEDRIPKIDTSWLAMAVIGA